MDKTKNLKRKGRPKGAINKSTADVRAIIAIVAQKNAKKIDAWLARIGRKNPAKAMDLYLRMLEYHIPKLTRTEIVKPPGNSGRVIDSSQLTADQREQLRQMILAQAEPALLEQTPANVLEPVGLRDAQVVDSVEDSESRTSVME
jgi:hypothetical protein